MSAQPRYDEPFYWWGPSGVSPIELSIGDLLRDGTIDPGSAAVLWAALVRRSSLAVIAGPSGAGKTTLLSALLEFLPPGMRRLYLRGCFETFAFLDDPSAAPATTALLVNEISPHLPVYLWGPAVERCLQAAEEGFALFATAHAKSVPEFVSTLKGSPLRIPAPRVAAFRYVVVLERAVDAPSGRRVSGVWRLAPTRSGVGMQPVPWQPSRAMTDEPRDASPTTVARHFPERELPWRGHVLERLRDGELARLPDERWPPAAVGAGHGP